MAPSFYPATSLKFAFNGTLTYLLRGPVLSGKRGSNSLGHQHGCARARRLSSRSEPPATCLLTGICFHSTHRFVFIPPKNWGRCATRPGAHCAARLKATKGVVYLLHGACCKKSKEARWFGSLSRQSNGFNVFSLSKPLRRRWQWRRWSRWKGRHAGAKTCSG